MDMGLPPVAPDDEPTLYMEQLTSLYRSFRQGNMTRIEYLDEIQRITRDQRSIGSYQDGKRVRIDSGQFADDLLNYKHNEYAGLGWFKDSDGRWSLGYWTTGTTPGLTSREMAGMMDAIDDAK